MRSGPVPDVATILQILEFHRYHSVEDTAKKFGISLRRATPEGRLNNVVENLQLRVTAHGAGATYRCRNCQSTDIEAIPLNNVERKRHGISVVPPISKQAEA